MLQLDTQIRRETPRRERRKIKDITAGGILLCCIAAILAIATYFRWPKFLYLSMYGVFGVYVYAILLLTVVIGASIAFSKRYAVNTRYCVFSTVMIFSALTAIHVIATRDFLSEAETSFSGYLGKCFSNITPGGVLFSVPSFVIWTIFGGMAGAVLVLVTTFLISSAFLTTFIMTKYGENKIIKRKPASAAPEREKDSSANKDLLLQINKKYQEILQKESRENMEAEKSRLGLNNVSQKVRPSPIYTSTVPIERAQPISELTSISTMAASTMQQGLNQNIAQPYSPQPVSGADPEYIGGGYGQIGAAPERYQPTYEPRYEQPKYEPKYEPAPYAAQAPWTPPTDAMAFKQTAPVDNSQVENVLAEYEIENEKSKIPTNISARARNPKRAPVAMGQESFGDVLETTKKPKVFIKHKYNKPTLDLIQTKSTDLSMFYQEAIQKKDQINDIFDEFNVGAHVEDYLVSPAITRYDVVLNRGTRVQSFESVAPNIYKKLGDSVRIKNIEGKDAIGIEVPNTAVGKVSIKDILLSREWAEVSKRPLGVAIGKSVTDEIIAVDIGDMPHMLIAGATGTGKSVFLNTILTSLILHASPDDVKLLLIDVKRVELVTYQGIPHMLIPESINDEREAICALKWLDKEMGRRYKVFGTYKGTVKKIEDYHSLQDYQNGRLEQMPYILTVIDEAGTLMDMGKREMEDLIRKICSLGRAAGIHIIFATQRPSTDVISGSIKTNIPSRFGLRTVSWQDSQTIIGAQGCEKLVGKGDMIYLKEGGTQKRIQCAFVATEEVQNIMDYIRTNNACDFDSELEELIRFGSGQNDAADGFGDGGGASRDQDDLIKPICLFIASPENKKGIVSTSLLQRKFKIGYPRCARIMDELTEKGYISEQDGTKPRNVIITYDEAEGLSE
jgi:DNA segregation ATPase FtsK/SpoIIIE-like protein